jgi:probable HAF family extracellular repeat protein
MIQRLEDIRNSKKGSIGPLIIFMSWAALPAHNCLGAAGDIRNLGTLGGPRSFGFGVNNSGQVAGHSMTTSSLGSERAFRYDPALGGGGVMYNLGTFGGMSSGSGINNLGQVAGSAGGGASRAFRYDGTPGSGEIMHNLGILPGGFHSYGVAVNDAGQVAGRADVPSVHGDMHVFRYDGTPGSGGVMHDLGSFGGLQSYVGGINESGQVSGSSYTSGGDNFSERAFRYDGTPGIDGIMCNLGTLGGRTSVGRGINDSGQVVGYSETALFSQVNHAFRYDGTPGIDGVMHDLGAPAGATFSQAHGINDAGFIVGQAGAGTPENPPFAVLWRPDFSSVNLDLWLDSVNPSLGAYWQLGVAYDISDIGFITGVGAYSDGPGGLTDGERAYLLDGSTLVVPEPAVLSLMALVALPLVRQRRQRHCDRR